MDAHGWPHDLTDEQILELLLALNLARARASDVVVAPAQASFMPDTEAAEVEHAAV